MIRLLREKLVKGALFALISSVMIFGVFFLNPSEVHAQAPNISGLFNSEWSGQSFQLTDTSVQAHGFIELTDLGDIITDAQGNERFENRFAVGENFQDYAYIETAGVGDDHQVGFFSKITKTSDGSTVFSPGGASSVSPPTSFVSWPSNRFLQLSHTQNLPITTQRAVFSQGSLESSTAYSIQLYGAALLYDINADNYETVEVFPVGSPYSFQTLAAGQNPSGVAAVTGFEDHGGLTGFDQAVEGLPCEAITDLLQGCTVQFLNFTVYPAATAALRAGGKIFDILTSLAISSKVYRDSTFVTSGWSIVRDISNIFFIFVLLIAAFKTIFGKGDTQNTIKNVIIVALLINFSLFMVRVVIDSTNILAHMLYNQISITGASGQELPPDIAIEGVGVQRDLSVGIANGLSVQSFISGPGVEQFLVEMGRNVMAAATIVIFAIIVTLMAAWMFFKVGFMMLGRIIGLWMVMILAPLAFVMNLIPGAATYLPKFSFNSWMKDLVQYSILAPVFLFFIYLIMLFINSHFLDGFLTASNYDSYERLIVIFLSFLVILGLLKVATETAESLSGDAGRMFGDWAAKGFKAVAGVGAGVVGGAALAGTGLLARQTLGRAGSAMANRAEWAKDWETSDNWLKRQTGAKFRNIGKSAEGASFDGRSGVLGKGLGSGLSKLGVKADFDNSAVGALGGSVKGGAGGFQKTREDASKNRLERAKGLKTGPDSDLALSVYDKRKQEARAKKAYDDEVLNSGKDSGSSKLLKTQLDTRTGQRKEVEAKRKQKDSERTLNYADRVEEQSGLRYGKTGASQTADKIRSTTSSPGDLEKIKKILESSKKEEEKTTSTTTTSTTTPTGTGTTGGTTASAQPGVSNPDIEKVIQATKNAAAQNQRGGQSISSGEGERREIAGFSTDRRKAAGLPTGLAENDIKADEVRARVRDSLTEERKESGQEAPKTRTEYQTVAETSSQQQPQTVEVKLDSSDLNLNEPLEKLSNDLKEVGQSIEGSSKSSDSQVSGIGSGIESAIKSSDQRRTHQALLQRKATAKGSDKISKSIKSNKKESNLKVVRDSDNNEPRPPREVA